jgi:S-sulfo-L-cysteine synthase (O-acetyl-L-serine-dependent)
MSIALKEIQNKAAAVGHHLTTLVGNTPLVRLQNLFRVYPNITVAAKLEWFNPGGSVKDRPALNMIREGERTGQLNPDKIIIDATSGNTGIAYALFGASLGYRVTLAMPSNASPERKKILTALGAELILTDPMEGTDGAQRTVQDLVRKDPRRYFYPDQYNNDANWRAHYRGTGPEIYSQTDGMLTHFIAGLGTTGTFTGVTRYLKEKKADIQCISVQPDSPLHAIEGWKHLPTALVPGIFDPELADDTLEVTTEDAYEFVKRTAREEGLLIGVSAGAVLAAIDAYIRGMIENDPYANAVIVTVLPDSADKYLSDDFWNE